MKIKAVTSQDLMKAISEERFSGELGELNHFIKGGDMLMATIDAKATEDLINQGDVNSLKTR